MVGLRKHFVVTIAFLLFVSLLWAIQGGTSVFAAPKKVVELDMSAEGNILTDLTDNGYNATIVSNETAPAGVFRKPINSDLTYGSIFAREFIWAKSQSDISKTYALIGDLTNGTPLMDSMSGDVTVETWVNAPSDGGYNLVTCNSNDFKINLSPKGTGFQIFFYRGFSTSAPSWITSTAVIPFGTWTHIVLTYSPSAPDIKPVIYINGVSVAVSVNTAGTAGGIAKRLNAPVILGNQYGSDVNYQWKRPFKGQIASFEVYEGIATAAEAKNYYDESKVNFSWSFDPQIFDANESLVTQSNINNVPVDASKIDIVFKTQPGLVIKEDTVNMNNITLTNTQTGIVYSYLGIYDPMTKIYTIRDFGDLENGTRYKLSIDKIKYTTDALVSQNEQILYFTTKQGMAVDSIEYKNKTDGSITSLLDETYAKVCYKVTNHNENDQNAVLISALFKGDELIDIKSESILVPKGTSGELNCILDWTEYGASGEYHISTYFCDTISSMHVLAQNHDFK